ncbi:ComEC/Rec2 family competence protein [Chitinophaga ginsengisegetis]|nr:MBL fold metallo-hydrolase [Chitinophaga ginsengisegetis]
MKITFKDVGQGDSIVLEWTHNGIAKIGIVDCSKKGKSNPVLTHLKQAGYKEIEFIILTHPHRDHYSGLLELLEYIENKRITVHRVAHTILFEGGKKFWKYFEADRRDTLLLRKIIGKWEHLKRTGVIKRMDGLMDDKTWELEEHIHLRCLAPSHDDIQEYMRLVKLEPDINSKEASQAANLLSAIFRLSINNCYALLTSDAEIFTLRGIAQRSDKQLSDRKFIVCQLPHHGSIKNHHKYFWDLIEKTDGRNAVISAGKHRHYNHPSYEVVTHFHQEGYQMHCTNIINGMEQFILEQRAISRMFDTFSEIAEDYMKSNDKAFTLS